MFCLFCFVSRPDVDETPMGAAIVARDRLVRAFWQGAHEGHVNVCVGGRAKVH